jgi:hypothetical protein
MAAFMAATVGLSALAGLATTVAAGVAWGVTTGVLLSAHALPAMNAIPAIKSNKTPLNRLMIFSFFLKNQIRPWRVTKAKHHFKRFSPTQDRLESQNFIPSFMNVDEIHSSTLGPGLGFSHGHSLQLGYTNNLPKS